MRSHKEEYDVIVVGGGPAGCATATHLARAGREVLLLERAEIGRDKPCGEVFSPPVRGMLRTLGALDDVTAAGAANINGATIRCIGGLTFAGGYDAQHSGLCLERTHFDTILWENAARAGVNVRRGVSVRRVIRDGDARIVGVQTDAGDLRAQIVVGADGSRSRIAREMGVVRPYRHLQKLAVVAHFQTNDKNAQEQNRRHVEMHVAPNDVVCGFAYGAHSVVNLTFELPMDASGGGESGQIAKYGGREGFVGELLRRFPAVAERLHGATLLRVATCGTFGHGTTTPIADGALLVGDAATFVDPFTGEGVHHALRGAELAAEPILDALRHGDTSARGLRSYARARQAELAPRYFVCDVVQGLVHRRGIFEFLAGKFARRPNLANALVSVTGDLATPYRLLSPRFLFSLATA